MKYLTVIIALVLCSCSQLAKLESNPIVKEAEEIVGPTVLKEAASVANTEIASLNKQLGGTAATQADVQNLASSAANALYKSMTSGTPPTASSVENSVLQATSGQLPQTAAAIAQAYAQSASGKSNPTLASLATLVSSIVGIIPGGTVAGAVDKVKP